MEELLKTIKDKGYSVSEVAAVMGCSRQNLYQKLNKERSFTVDDIIVIRDALELNQDQMRLIFGV